ncbi:putative glucan 1,3-beta-glucosidase [Aureobasidium sp. EXF-3400]|nr:putative glucan 1,3-beta-glucosidase [Aureobasidium sp. EXF-12344]KAI4770126.1 putative glucan 1,3-beta-glucosidase [Aureobasidium sp. EXF-3400]
MRNKTLITGFLLAFCPFLISAAGTLGFALGDKKADGSCKFHDDYEADFDAIKSNSGSTIVRIYAASDCNTAAQILPAAKIKGFKVILGVWPDVDQSLQADKQALQIYVPQYLDQVYGVTVGSETLYRKTFTGPQLLEKINDVKSVLPSGIKVGTADSWNKFADGTADAVIKGGVDFLLANGFAYWQASPISNATYTFFDDTQQALGHIQSVSGSLNAIEFWVGETGWPTDGGSNYGAAIAGTKNAQTYFEDAVCGMLSWGVNVFVFEAFDEPWKPHAIGDSGSSGDETHWGVMNVDRSTKFPLTC